MSSTIQLLLSLLFTVSVITACSDKKVTGDLSEKQVEYLQSRLEVRTWGDSARWEAGRQQGIADALQELEDGRAIWYFDTHPGIFEHVESICGLPVLPREWNCLPSEERSGRQSAHDSTIAAELLKNGIGSHSMQKWRQEIEEPGWAFAQRSINSPVHELWPDSGGSAENAALNRLQLVAVPNRRSKQTALITANRADTLRPEYILWSRVQTADSVFAVLGDSASGLAFIKLVMNARHWDADGPIQYLAADLRTGIVLNQAGRY